METNFIRYRSRNKLSQREVRLSKLKSPKSELLCTLSNVKEYMFGDRSFKWGL